jgi:hypothetical protein
MLDHRFQMTVLPRHLAPFRDQLRQLFVIPNSVLAQSAASSDFNSLQILVTHGNIEE